LSRTTAVTGSASGMGAAVRARLERDGDRVIGVDRRDAEVVADLGTVTGRREAVEAVLEAAGGRLDRLVLAAGVGPTTPDLATIARVNYFGALSLLDGLLPALQAGREPACVLFGSNSAQLVVLDDRPLVKALLEGDEDAAAREAEDLGDGNLVYMCSKNALGRAMRRRARAFGELGVRLNAVAPGPTRTPMLEAILADPVKGKLVRDFVVPLGRDGDPPEVAGLVAFLLGPDAAWIHGGVYYIDGGADASFRPDRY
jgi:NAD(P)-dependent dehydrogenase (short-subunit alcohol dehydrogenase family)